VLEIKFSFFFFLNIGVKLVLGTGDKL